MNSPLRAMTYLAPGIPLELFELIVGHLRHALGREIRLSWEDRHSGPMHAHRDPFATGEVDFAFLCSPSYLYLSSQTRPSVDLVPAAFVFDDERTKGRPLYYSEVLVRRDHPARTFDDLKGCTWGFNDRCSLSGYFSANQELQRLGCAGGYFDREVDTGSHRHSVELLLSGEIDAAAIDCNVFSLLQHEHPSYKTDLRKIASWGPFPVQPIVLRAELSATLLTPLANALLGMHEHRELAQDLARFGVARLAPVSPEDYEEERRAMKKLGALE